ncbi:MAG: hypothetical protein CML06_13830 [Pseudomonadales bacterium]|nr:hypothetical protein [Pseudomonadales bacterium]
MTQLSFSEYYAMQKNEGGTVFAMLSLDLNNADESQRSEFNQALEKSKWQKIEGITTTWKRSFQAGISESDIVKAAESDVKKAAMSSGIGEYKAAVNVGYGPREFK